VEKFLPNKEKSILLNDLERRKVVGYTFCWEFGQVYPYGLQLDFLTSNTTSISTLIYDVDPERLSMSRL